MAPTQDIPHHHHTLFTINNPTHFIQSYPSTCHSFPPPSKLFFPLPFPFSFSPESSSVSAHNDPQLRSKPGQPGSGIPSMVRIDDGLKQNGPGPTAGPAFLGLVYTVSVHPPIHIPQRAPEWMKKFISTVLKNESDHISRFFMDVNDADSYVRQLNIPNDNVGTCTLDFAYQRFKENPHLFRFVPNSKQVKEANKLMKRIKKTGGKRIDGVPVFSAQNLDMAMVTPQGVKWYTPYYFDKSILDNILEESADDYFDDLIHNRHVQRQRDIIDDNMAAEIIEETADNVWESTEAEDLMDEIGQSGIPLSVISKAAELQFQYAVDKVLLGNRWFRKATGIQPKFPYLVDSFERRSAASWSRARKSTSSTLMEVPNQQPGIVNSDRSSNTKELEMSALLPRITMIGIDTSENGQTSNATINKTIENLSKELEQGSLAPNSGVDLAPQRWCNNEDRDPLFFANAWGHNPTMGRTTSTQWVRGVHD